MKKGFVIIIILFFSLSAGCISQSNIPENKDNSTLSTITTHSKLHSVNFHLLDQNNTPIEHAFISASYNSSAYINGNFSVDLIPNEMKGYTDENGNQTFVMHELIQYNITITTPRDGMVISKQIIPMDTDYILRLHPTLTPVATPTRTSGSSMHDNIFWWPLVRPVCQYFSLPDC